MAEQYRIERAIKVGRFMVDTRNTCSSIAKEFGVSASTIRRDIVELLPELNPELANQCKVIIDYHRSIAYIRGGEANKTRLKALKRSV